MCVYACVYVSAPHTHTHSLTHVYTLYGKATISGLLISTRWQQINIFCSSLQPSSVGLNFFSPFMVALSDGLNYSEARGKLPPFAKT